MTTRRDRLPPEFRHLNPEDYIDVFLTPEGQIATPERRSIAAQLDRQEHSFAFALMRFQLVREAMKVLRREGCKFLRYDALWLADTEGSSVDSGNGLAAIIADATEYIGSRSGRGEPAVSALEVLCHLKWQIDAIAQARSETEADNLRRMALVSTSLGFTSAVTGIEGVTSNLLDMEKDATAFGQGRLKGAEQNRRKGEAWATPLLDYAADYLSRRSHMVRYKGLGTKIIASFRRDHPAIIIPESNRASTVLGAFLTEQLGPLRAKQ